MKTGASPVAIAIGLVFCRAGAGHAAETPSAAAKGAAAVFEAAGCRECHNAEGVASDTRLVFPEPGSPKKVVEEAAAQMFDLVNTARPDESRLLRKPTRRLTHEGGLKIKPGSAEEKAVIAWLSELGAARAGTAAVASLLSSSVPVAGPPERGGFRRLTHSQYDNTVRDLLGDITGPARTFPPEDFVDGFKNQYQAQSASPLLAEAYGAAAERLATDALRYIRLRDSHRLLPCKLPRTGGGDAACRDRFIADFGRRAFRRPIADAEHARYAALFAAQKGFAEGVKIVIEAMLQSPSFLHIVDTTDPVRRPYARAARLAYFLWNTMPDDALLDAAGRGELDTPEGIDRTTARLLADGRAHQAVDEYVAQWLRLDRVRGAFKDRRQFPMFTPELASAMAEETRRMVADLVWNDQPFTTLFSADYSFVNADLAAVYGMPAPPAPFDKVQYPAGSGRIGVLGHGTFLTGTSKPGDTSPTARGLFIREQFLCQKVPTPPPGVNMNLPPLDEEKPLTNRDRLHMHLSEERCARCHNLIDSIGFGFEKFDAIGRRQEVLKVSVGRRKNQDKPDDKKADAAADKKPVELALDTRGAIAGLASSSFTDARDIGPILAKSGACQECMAKQVFRFATGRHETPADRAVVDRVFSDFKRSGFRFKQLLMSVARWTEFAPPGDG